MSKLETLSWFATFDLGKIVTYIFEYFFKYSLRNHDLLFFIFYLKVINLFF